MSDKTIAAIATPLSNSGIGIIRISGDKAIEIADKVFKAKSNKKLMDQNTHTIHYGFIYDNDSMIDEVMVMLMKKPNSFTAEDTVEIDCHGGILIMKKILNVLLNNGAYLAEPGEFSKRAFLNGRIDLSRAEAIMDLIQSKNDNYLKSSLSQLNGSLFNSISGLREKLIYEIAFIESALDDPEHYSLDGYYDMLKNIIIDINKKVNQYIQTYDYGKIMKEGIDTCIIGRPNAGKSTLLNYLLGEDKAIVTDIAGTTRDILEQSISIDGISLNLIDTAGIRDTEDVVEKIGVEKAFQYLNRAELVIYILDNSIEMNDDDLKIINNLENKEVIILLNKIDKNPLLDKEKLEDLLMQKQLKYKIIETSFQNESGQDILIQTIKDIFITGKIESNDEIMISNLRHKEAFMNVNSSLTYVLNSIDQDMPEDFLFIDLMNAYAELGKIIGEEVQDDLVNEIFSKFCMGK